MTLLPPESAGLLSEPLLARHSRRSQAIYLAVVLALLAGVAALPFLRVTVAVRSEGVLRPQVEKQVVRARASGYVEALAARENQRVRQGELLARLRAAPVDARAALVSAQTEQARALVADLQRLTRAADLATPDAGTLRTPRYRQELSELRNALAEHALQEERAAREAERARVLARQQLIAASEAEEREFRLAQLRAERALLVERARSGWQAAPTAQRDALKELAAQASQLREERGLYAVSSPVDGTVEQLGAVAVGSYLQAGEELAVISPEAGLVAEVYVAPRDIGLLRVGMPVRLQVDAFNYNDWGVLTGRVHEVPSDFTLSGQTPVYRVKVGLDRTHLALKNGFRGHLKKGMTLRAHFLVAERSLLQLLRDDVNDWLHPAQGRAS